MLKKIDYLNHYKYLIIYYIKIFSMSNNCDKEYSTDVNNENNENNENKSLNVDNIDDEIKELLKDENENLEDIINDTKKDIVEEPDIIEQPKISKNEIDNIMKQLKNMNPEKRNKLISEISKKNDINPEDMTFDPVSKKNYMRKRMKEKLHKKKMERSGKFIKDNYKKKIIEENKEKEKEKQKYEEEMKQIIERKAEAKRIKNRKKKFRAKLKKKLNNKINDNDDNNKLDNNCDNDYNNDNDNKLDNNNS